MCPCKVPVYGAVYGAVSSGLHLERTYDNAYETVDRGGVPVCLLNNTECARTHVFPGGKLICLHRGGHPSVNSSHLWRCPIGTRDYPDPQHIHTHLPPSAHIL